jgi:competence protein ComEC
MLVDAGGAPSSGFDIGARVVAPALRALGVQALDSLVITHADPDHVGGAASILHAFAASNVWEGVPVPHDPAMRQLAALAASARASWRVLQAGDVQREGEIEIRVLHPPPPEWERQRVRNDDSVVLEIRVGEVSIVLPGDIERGAEQIVLPRLSLAPLVVLKAPHHGSATSSTPPFVTAAHPAAVIFSAGQSNRFGHPAAAVVARYAAARVPAFNTATDGAVILDTDGRSVEIRGWASGRGVVLGR